MTKLGDHIITAHFINAIAYISYSRTLPDQYYAKDPTIHTKDIDSTNFNTQTVAQEDITQYLLKTLPFTILD